MVPVEVRLVVFTGGVLVLELDELDELDVVLLLELELVGDVVELVLVGDVVELVVELVVVELVVVELLLDVVDDEVVLDVLDGVVVELGLVVDEVDVAPHGPKLGDLVLTLLPKSAPVVLATSTRSVLALSG